MDEEAKRKLQAKRLNEHIKLLVTTVNACALVLSALASFNLLSVTNRRPM